MDRSNHHYVHGTEPEEQDRLSRLNALLNASSLEAMDLRGGERILDVGSGLGQFTRMMARKAGAEGTVVGVERDDEQLAEAIRQARNDGEDDLVRFRRGDAVDLPLEDEEWGSFDIVHARFVLEHVTDPAAVVGSMLRAARPGGRIVLEDDDHDVLRLSPEAPGVLDLWRAYFKTYERQGKDPYVGRNLVSLLHGAGAVPRSNRCLFFGSCAGSPNFGAMVSNFLEILEGARDEIVAFGLAGKDEVDAGLEAFRIWRGRPDAAMWYTTSWAEGIRPAPGRVRGPTREPGREASSPTPVQPAAGPRGAPEDEAALLRFLMGAAAELSSTLELRKVFHRLATELRPVIDYHLFCVMLWNERTQLLEHSFSMKYGREIPQKGGFPLGYGPSGSAAALRKPVRVANVLEDPRYVRFRHPEVEIHSELAVPLVARDQLIGVLDLESTEYDYFTEAHEQMVSALASHIAASLVNARLFERVAGDERRLESDLATAREIQHGLLPETTPRLEGLEIGSAYTPARALGGDFYDFLPYRDGRVAIAVGDVAGKATPAALLGSMAVGLLRGHAVDHPWEPAEMLAELNGHLMSAGGESRFVAMAYAIWDEDAREIVVANAGLPRPILLTDGVPAPIPVVGTPLGMLDGSRYEARRLRPAAGSVLVFCSDGLMECENARGDTFDTARFGAVLGALAGRSAGEIATGLNEAAVEFAGGPEGQADDYTAVVLKFS